MKNFLPFDESQLVAMLGKDVETHDWLVGKLRERRRTAIYLYSVVLAIRREHCSSRNKNKLGLRELSKTLRQWIDGRVGFGELYQEIIKAGDLLMAEHVEESEKVV